MTRRFFVPAFCTKGQSAFSLLELLLTMAIILILFTLYWGPSRASRQRALQANCQKNLQQLYIALNLYADDQRGRFPVVPGAKTSAEALNPLVPRYTSDTSIFICPGSSDAAPPSGEPIRTRRISYAYYMGNSPTNQQALMSDRQVNTEAKDVGEVIFSTDGKPPGNNHRQYGGNVMYCDGHVQLSGPTAKASLPLPAGVVLLNPKP
ncbi:MAG TPA: type II secretion system protein [Verrucomicrobiae bacterium]|nr:type II secretion system protein [Verrucomicrobiae bacterium]